MATITIFYPSGHDFDLKYYLQTHMRVVERNWRPQGLINWEITILTPGQTYQVQAVLKFTSLAAWEQAVSSETAVTVFGDVPAFTTAEPIVFKGETMSFKRGI
ncbi:hypothetical protein E4U21_007875 [Claviceps maximensis]|nr:hypothetical protein E4U21_007875 [Claviceps maximensis]